MDGTPKLHIKGIHNNIIKPKVTTNGGVGIDVFVPRDIHLEKDTPKLAGMGICLHIDPGYYVRVVPRISAYRRFLYAKEMTVSSSYNGELFILVQAKMKMYIKKGVKIAQMIVAQEVIPRVTFEFEPIAAEIRTRRKRRLTNGNTDDEKAPEVNENSRVNTKPHHARKM